MKNSYLKPVELDGLFPVAAGTHFINLKHLSKEKYVNSRIAFEYFCVDNSYV